MTTAVECGLGCGHDPHPGQRCMPPSQMTGRPLAGDPACACTDPEFTRPECQIIGEDGNVFAIIGRVRKVLKRAGQAERAEEFTKRAMASHSYDEVLNLLDDYVEVC